MNTIAELIDSLKNEIVELESREQQSCWGTVIIYTNECRRQFYGVANGNYNGLAEPGLENIYPQPSINRIKVMGRTEADEQVKNLRMITDGKGKRYFANKVSLRNYIAMLINRNKRMLIDIEEMSKRYE